MTRSGCSARRRRRSKHQVARLRRRLQEADRTLQGANNTLATPDPRPIGEQIGLTQTRQEPARSSAMRSTG